MLSTATALIDAVGNSIMDEEVMDLARVMLHTRNEMSENDFAKAMYLYSGVIASNVADKVTKVLLTETQLRELMLSIDELESIRNLVLEENN
jgi:hypothetical protein